MIDIDFVYETLTSLLPGIPLTLKLALLSTAVGAVLALGLALMRMSRFKVLSYLVQVYVFFFRGTPLLVQIFLLYYGLGQFPEVRESFLWPFLREPYWCAIVSLALCTAAYGSEIIRGGLRAVPYGQIEAARACGMSRTLVMRRIILPLAIRNALPAYGNELIVMVKSTSLASIITLMEITGIAARLIAESYRVLEVFVVAGLIYLLINFVLTRLLARTEYLLSPHLRPPPSTARAPSPIVQKAAS